MKEAATSDHHRIARKKTLRRRRRSDKGNRREAGSDWEQTNPFGPWMSFQRPATNHAGPDPLELHSQWPGPVKLVDSGRGNWIERFDFYIDPLGGGWASTVDEERAKQADELIARLHEGVFGFTGQTSMPGWCPPPPEVVSQWLEPVGVTPVIDEAENVRFTLQRKGFSGQVRVMCGDGRIRFVLPLGKWEELSVPSEQAMRHLANVANSRYRLVRVVWNCTQGVRSSCEVQVDLSGLPWCAETDSCTEDFWQGMIRKAVGAVALAMHQLGLELDALADPKNGELARLCL